MTRDRISTSRFVAVLATLTVLLLIVLVLGSLFGTAKIGVRQVVAIVMHQLLGVRWSEWQPWEAVIVLDVRLPRVLVGALVGGALALSGAVLQGIFRNPMADPGILGATAGATLGAVSAIYLGWSAASIMTVPLAAFVGAGVCTYVVYVIATVRGRTSITTLLLAGIAVGGLANALAAFVLSISLAKYEIGRQIIAWLLGQLDARTWLHVRIASPLILGGAAFLFAFARDLNVLALGEESALSLGVDVPRVRRSLIVVTSLLTAAAVAVSGSIAFIGLVVPHILRLLIGADHRLLLPASFLLGSVVLVAVDIVARTAVAPHELQLGVLTALLGGPFFIYLLLASRKSETEIV